MIPKIIELINSNKIEEACNIVLQEEGSLSDRGDYWGVRGYIALLLHEFESSIECFDRALILGSSDVDVYYNYAYACLSLGQNQKAAILFGVYYRYSDNEEIKRDIEKIYSIDSNERRIFELSSNLKCKNILLLSDSDCIIDDPECYKWLRILTLCDINVTYVYAKRSFSYDEVIDVSVHKNIDIVSVSMHHYSILSLSKGYKKVIEEWLSQNDIDDRYIISTLKETYCLLGELANREEYAYINILDKSVALSNYCISDLKETIFNCASYVDMRKNVISRLDEYSVVEKIFEGFKQCDNVIIEKSRENLLKKVSSEYIFSSNKVLRSTFANSSDKSNCYCLIDTDGALTPDSPLLSMLMRSVDGVRYILTSNISEFENKKNFNLECVTLRDIIDNENIVPLVFYDIKYKYVSVVRFLAENNIKECTMALAARGSIELYGISKEIMDSIREKEYLHTLAVCRRGSFDANVEAVLRNIPSDMQKYKIYEFDYDFINSHETIVKVPLVASVSLSGFGLFCKHPKNPYVHNIELWHGGLGFKALGLLDKDKESGDSWVEVFKNVDTFCIASDMNRMFYSSLFGIPESKYRVTGMSRSDLLLQDDCRNNLEKVLNISLGDKRVIFNLPTFHINELMGRIEGSSLLQDNFKLDNFNYNEFDDFLEATNSICISKPHYSETNTLESKFIKDTYKNIFFISNTELSGLGLNLYDILGAGHVLITDYSSVAGDYIFMNKPIVFLATDVEEYRNTKGFSLEPYDFWTPGEKVLSQKGLQDAIRRGLDSPNYYEEERLRLRPVFYKFVDNESSYRCWKVIESIFEKE